VHQVFVANHIKWELLRKVHGEAGEKITDYFHETYFGPMHEEIRRILRSKLYLVDGSEMPESFYLYLKHAAQERDQREIWKRYGIDTSFLKGQPWPDDFYNDITSGFEHAMRNYDESLEGLKA
jgi:hypothetical protein